MCLGTRRNNTSSAPFGEAPSVAFMGLNTRAAAVTEEPGCNANKGHDPKSIIAERLGDRTQHSRDPVRH